MEASEIIKNIENNLKELKEICGAKRPERKGLAEKFLTSILEHRTFGMGVCTIEDKCQREKLAKTAINHACEVVDSTSFDRLFGDVFIKEKLKQTLRDSI